MNLNEKKIACITGATSGIGAAFAKIFAMQGYDLIITGRRKEKIQSIAKDLSSEYKINVEVIIAELSEDKSLEALASKIKEMKNLEILVNNAGFGKKNLFHEEDYMTHEIMLKVHNLALVKLCHAVLPNMISNGNGLIINVSSACFFIPLPTQAMYSATKAFIKIFSESLYLELQGKGVKVQALCPGLVRTDFFEKMGHDSKDIYKESGISKAMTSEEVVDISLKCLEKNKVICIPGMNNKIFLSLFKKLPRSVIYKMASSIIKKM